MINRMPSGCSMRMAARLCVAVLDQAAVPQQLPHGQVRTACRYVRSHVGPQVSACTSRCEVDVRSQWLHASGGRSGPTGTMWQSGFAHESITSLRHLLAPNEFSRHVDLSCFSATPELEMLFTDAASAAPVCTD